MYLHARRQRQLGVIAIVAVAALLAASFRLDALSDIFGGGGNHYAAEFTDVAGIAPGDPVRVAGITVGRVEAVRVVGDHAAVDITVEDDVHLGDATSASLSIDTLLGQHSLALVPAGQAQMTDGSTIPLARTTTPFGIDKALLGTADALAPIDKKALTKALATIADALEPAAPEVRSAAAGLSSLARAVGSRDQEIQELFAATSTISSILAGRSGEIESLLANSGAVLATLNQRQQVIRALITDTTAFADVVTRVIKENQPKLTPGLEHLRRVVRVLRQHQPDLDESLRLLAPFLRYFTNVSGNGRYFDSTLSGVLPIDLRGGTP